MRKFDWLWRDARLDSELIEAQRELIESHKRCDETMESIIGFQAALIKLNDEKVELLERQLLEATQEVDTVDT